MLGSPGIFVARERLLYGSLHAVQAPDGRTPRDMQDDKGNDESAMIESTSADRRLWRRASGA